MKAGGLKLPYETIENRRVVTSRDENIPEARRLRRLISAKAFLKLSIITCLVKILENRNGGDRTGFQTEKQRERL